MSFDALVPDVDEVQRIVAIADPVLRNLEITACYADLAAAVALLQLAIGEKRNPLSVR